MIDSVREESYKRLPSCVVQGRTGANNADWISNTFFGSRDRWKFPIYGAENVASPSYALTYARLGHNFYSNHKARKTV